MFTSLNIIYENGKFSLQSSINNLLKGNLSAVWYDFSHGQQWLDCSNPIKITWKGIFAIFAILLFCAMLCHEDSGHIYWKYWPLKSHCKNKTFAAPPSAFLMFYLPVLVDCNLLKICGKISANSQKETLLFHLAQCNNRCSPFSGNSNTKSAH